MKVFRPQEVDSSVFLGWYGLDIVSKSSSSRLKTKCLDGGQFSLFEASCLVAMTVLRKTSRSRQLLTDKQQATSHENLKITSGTKHRRAHTTSKLLYGRLCIGAFYCTRPQVINAAMHS